ncbi:MAG: hypothetical protein EBZ93_11445, partial [Actinobacteria bacterium]|nr:hypothetical protein [Actinomycetota bacterium]
KGIASIVYTIGPRYSYYTIFNVIGCSTSNGQCLSGSGIGKIYIANFGIGQQWIWVFGYARGI